MDSFWDRNAASSRFTHPLPLTWIKDRVPRDAPVLDVGCGYGRSLETLLRAGYRNLFGLDGSPRMIERARGLGIPCAYHVGDARGLPYADGSIDLALAMALFTCVPDDNAQGRIVAEIRRVLRPGGLLLVSDLLLQDDARSRTRYREGRAEFGAYGVFRVDSDLICRHHERAHLSGLLGAFEPIECRDVDVTTMRGNRARAVQLLVGKSVVADLTVTSE